MWNSCGSGTDHTSNETGSSTCRNGWLTSWRRVWRSSSVDPICTCISCCIDWSRLLIVSPEPLPQAGLPLTRSLPLYRAKQHFVCDALLRLTRVHVGGRVALQHCRRGGALADCLVQHCCDHHSLVLLLCFSPEQPTKNSFSVSKFRKVSFSTDRPNFERLDCYLKVPHVKDLRLKVGRGSFVICIANAPGRQPRRWCACKIDWGCQ